MNGATALEVPICESAYRVKMDRICAGNSRGTDRGMYELEHKAGRLTEIQAKTILAYIKSDMNMLKTAKTLYCSSSSIYHQFENIQKNLGMNPREFAALKELEDLAKATLGEWPDNAESLCSTLNGYQALARRTMVDKCRNLCNAGLGLAGESGEVAELIKKHCFQGHALDESKLIEELGDVLWYIALTAEIQGVQLADIARRNIEKLKKRYPYGYRDEDSVNRKSKESLSLA